MIVHPGITRPPVEGSTKPVHVRNRAGIVPVQRFVFIDVMAGFGGKPEILGSI